MISERQKYLIQNTNQLILKYIPSELFNYSKIQNKLQKEIKDIWERSVEKVTYQYYIKENKLQVQIILHFFKNKSTMEFMVFVI